MNPFYITTPIYYVNGKPHFGHAYTSLLADMLTRFHALHGEEVFFLTGTDEHGDKIVRTAEKEGLPVQTLVDTYSHEFKHLWESFDVNYSDFIRTTEPRHRNVVQSVLQKIYDNGDIYFGEYGGHYCYGCERFYVEKELEEGLCPQHKTKPEYVKEKNYFFKMKQYLPWLREYINEHEDFIQPIQYRNEVLSMLERDELDDLCISRPKSRLSWGIELPFDTDYVCYVWFDALLNYLSGIGFPDSSLYTTFWPEAEHIIAKDIVKPHAIFWPCILKSAEIPLFKTLYVHGYWLSRDTKLSKSLGNAIDPMQLIQHYGVDAIRYFLLREMSFGSDATFSLSLVNQRIIAELANDIGNLFSRSIAMIHKYCHSLIPEPDEYTEEDTNLIYAIYEYIRRYNQYCSHVAPSRALECIVNIASSINKYIDAQAPWALYKNQESKRLTTVLYTVAEGLRKIAIMLLPVIPSTARTMLALLGIHSLLGITLNGEEKEWGRLEVGSKVALQTNLFPRTQWENISIVEEDKHTEAEQTLEYISFADIAKIDIRIGTILHAERVAGAKSLLLLRVDVGEESVRNIVSGIAQHCTPEEIIGKQSLVIVNLEPKMIRGIESQGMMLTIQDGEKIHILEPTSTSSNGSRVL